MWMPNQMERGKIKMENNYLTHHGIKGQRWGIRRYQNKDGREIHGRIIIHHMNPITIEDIEKESEYLIDPEFLITTVLNTHNAIHYGDESLLILMPVERTRNDTCPWKR